MRLRHPGTSGPAASSARNTERIPRQARAAERRKLLFSTKQLRHSGSEWGNKREWSRRFEEGRQKRERAANVARAVSDAIEDMWQERREVQVRVSVRRRRSERKSGQKRLQGHAML